ncbi:MAG: S8 family serine peptidase [Bacteroidales bacterium]|nr:S8 family serine peptidase [Candidatus Latescibacterota bacterium]
MKVINYIILFLSLLVIPAIEGELDIINRTNMILDAEKNNLDPNRDEAGYMLLEHMVEEANYFIPAVDDRLQGGDRSEKSRSVTLSSSIDPGPSIPGVRDPLWDQMWGWRAAGLEEAWKHATGEGVTIAIIDTGCDLGHPDLEKSLWTNEMEFSGLHGVDDDGNGYIDDLHGYDFVSVSEQSMVEGEDGWPPDGDPGDTNGHGTHVAGIIGAVAGNGLGIEGVAPRCRLMILRAAYTDLYGAGALSGHDVAEAIRYAVAMGADVINMSFGGGYSEEIHREIIIAEKEGIVLVSSAGNNGAGSELFPASCLETIAVGASDPNGNPAIFSSCVPGVDCLAPGVSVISTGPGGYAVRSGTSTAAPFVSGTAALILSGPEPVPLEMVRGRILSGCLREGSDDEILYGCRGCGNIRADLSIAANTRYFAVPESSELITDDISDCGIYPPGRKFILIVRARNLLERIEGGQIQIEPDREGIFTVAPVVSEQIDLGTDEIFEARYELVSLVPIDEGEMIGFRFSLVCDGEIQTTGIDQQVPAAPRYTSGAVALFEMPGDGNGAADPGERIELEIEIYGPDDGGTISSCLDVSEISTVGSGFLVSEAVLNGEGRALLSFEFVIADLNEDRPDLSLSGSVPAYLPLSIEGEDARNTTEIPLWISYRGDAFTSDPPVCFQGGGAHTGIFHDGPGTDLKMKWNYDIPGTGSIVCQPAVSRKMVFAARREGEKSVVYAVDRASGGFLWRRKLPGECRHAPRSMLWAGGVLFVPSGRYLCAVDCETGAIVWSRTVGVEEGWKYTAGEPVGDQDVIVCTFHCPETGADDIVMAMDRLTGNRLWIDRDHEMVYGTAPPALDRTELVVVDLAGRMAAFDISSGRRLWTIETGISPGFPLMISSHAAIICGGGGRIGAFLIEDGMALWECETGAIPQGPPCLTPDGMMTVVVRTGLVPGILRIGPSGDLDSPLAEIGGYGFSGAISSGGMIFSGREDGRIGIYSTAGESIAEVPIAPGEDAAAKLPFISGEELYVCVNTNGRDILIALAHSGGQAPSVRGRIVNYPNPFNPSTTIRFINGSGGHVRLRVFDVAGRLVRTIVDEFLPAGPGEYTWDGLTEKGSVASSGVFFAMLECPDGTFTRKILLLK